MKCRLARKYINEHVDGSLDAGRLSALKSHLEYCSGCRDVLSDFERIVGDARGLAEMNPPDRVWFKIRAGVRAPGAASPAFRPSPAFRYRFALASAAALLIVAAGLFVVQPWKSGLPPANAEKAALNQTTLNKLSEAEWHYHQAIKALREAVEAQKGSLDPEVARVFAANLQIVDSSIEACRQAVRNDPRDIRAQNALLSSYGEKVQVLTDWVSAQKLTVSEKEPAVKL